METTMTKLIEKMVIEKQEITYVNDDDFTVTVKHTLIEDGNKEEIETIHCYNGDLFEVIPLDYEDDAEQINLIEDALHNDTFDIADRIRKASIEEMEKHGISLAYNIDSSKKDIMHEYYCETETDEYDELDQDRLIDWLNVKYQAIDEYIDKLHTHNTTIDGYQHASAANSIYDEKYIIDMHEHDKLRVASARRLTIKRMIDKFNS